MRQNSTRQIISGIADPSHDLLHHKAHPLDVFFRPKSVALVGASEKPDTAGRNLMWNLVTNSFGGILYPVNAKRPSVMGIKAYPDISSVPEKVDLAVIATPASSVPGVIQECVKLGIKGAVVISAGFKEIGAEGVKLEEQIMKYARQGKMRIIGPNCYGVMCPPSGLNATFSKAMARPGNIGFISQSGALNASILDWSFNEFVGFSAFISVGSMLDVGWGDLIDYLGRDPNTEAIVIYMESIGNARSFISAAREVALIKPIIVIKAGRTEAAAKAAASHTGSLTGSDEVLHAAFRRCGVLRVNTIADLFHMAEVLSKQPRPKGPRLTILTNAGGPGVLAADDLIVNGGELAKPSKETIAELDKFLPAHWSHNNPIDILGDATPERYAKALEITAKDTNTDGMLVILIAQAVADPTQTAEQLKPYAKIEGKPVLASWMGGASITAGETILNKAGIPTYRYPDTATRIFTYMWRYTYNLRGLYETPAHAPDDDRLALGRELAGNIITAARKNRKTILNEYESKELIAAYGIPVVPTRKAVTEEEAAKVANEIGYPVVLKLLSDTITHKTDVGGVRLNLADAGAVKSAFRAIKNAVEEKTGKGNFSGVTVQPMIKAEGYELIIGSSIDPQFGPIILFGSGGQLVEVFKDRALALPPLNSTLARRMMEQTRIYKALKGVRGRKPVNFEALEDLLVNFSNLVVVQPWIKEIDINPLLASPEKLLVLDARVILHGPEMTDDKLPRLAVRPYPARYISRWKTSDGMKIAIRPIRPEDEPLLVEFHEGLSEKSVYFRYARPVQLSWRVAHERLSRICFPDYDRAMVLVAEIKDAKDAKRRIIAVARWRKIGGAEAEANFALVVSDKFQGRGLGTQLMRRLMQIARDEKISWLSADLMTENKEMQNLCKKLGFSSQNVDGTGLVHVELNL